MYCFPEIIFVTRTQETKRPQQKNAAMEVVDDVCVSEGVCEVMCDELSDQPEHGESMETHVSGNEAAHMANSASGEAQTDGSAAAPGSMETSSEPTKPLYSYRSVYKQVCCKALGYS